MDELEEFSREFKKRLDDAGDAKLVPEDLALEVQKESFPYESTIRSGHFVLNFVSVLVLL